MIKQSYAAAVGFLHAAIWPLSGVFLHGSTRVRIVILHDDLVLLQRSGFGSQSWSLPGGGVKKNEDPVEATIREAKEETNISLKAKDVHFLEQRSVPTRRNWPIVTMLFFKSELQNSQEPKVIRPLEILSVKWFKLSELPSNRSKTVNLGLEALQAKLPR